MNTPEPGTTTATTATTAPLTGLRVLDLATLFASRSPPPCSATSAPK